MGVGVGFGLGLGLGLEDWIYNFEQAANVKGGDASSVEDFSSDVIINCLNDENTCCGMLAGMLDLPESWMLSEF